MPYPINERLEMRVGYFSHDRAEKYQQLRKQLDCLSTLEEKLKFFNRHISSLSKWPMDKVTFVDWSEKGQETVIYCGRRECKCGLYSAENEALYWKLRAKEVKRLTREIAKRETYTDKLTYLLTQPGFRPVFTEVKVYPNIFLNPKTDGRSAMYDTPAAVSLVPETSEEHESFNRAVLAAFLEHQKPNGRYSHRYRGFDFDKERIALENALQKALEPEVIIRQVLEDIDTFTHYKQVDPGAPAETPESLRGGMPMNLIRHIAERSGWKQKFVAMVEGHYLGLDFSRSILRESDFEEEEHARQVFLFYQHVSELKTGKKDFRPLPKVPFIGDLFHQNLNIPDIVYNRYYSLVRQPRSKEETPNFYVGRLNWYNSPFQYSIYGAYPLMSHWESLQARRGSISTDIGQAPEQEYNAALERYSAAFVKAYYSFDKDYLQSGPFSDTSQRIQKVFDFATGRAFSLQGFPESHGPGISLFDTWGEAGAEAGMFYRVWYLIIENYAAFLELFEKQIPKSVMVESVEPTLAEQLAKSLNEYGFSSLPKIAHLSTDQRQKLVEKIAGSAAPYQVAMLDSLGFLEHALSKHWLKKSRLDKELALMLRASERTIKGNRLVLQERTEEDRERYTAHQYKLQVVNDYEKIK